MRFHFKNIAAALAVGVSSLLVGSAASAITLNGSYSLGGSAFSGPHAVLGAAPVNSSFSFDLEEGETATIDLFKVHTNKSIRDSFVHLESVASSFVFDDPVSTGTLSAQTDGIFLHLFKIGALLWDNPVVVTFGDTGAFTVSLSHLLFNTAHGGDSMVRMTVDYKSAPSASPAPTPVPLPAGGALLLGAMGGLALVRRRRKA